MGFLESEFIRDLRDGWHVILGLLCVAGYVAFAFLVAFIVNRHLDK